MARDRARRCDHCGKPPRGRSSLALTLTCVRRVYAYRWLCTLCAARRSRRGGSRA